MLRRSDSESSFLGEENLLLMEMPVKEDYALNGRHNNGLWDLNSLDVVFRLEYD